MIKLASNENPLPPSDRVLKAIADALPYLNRYPDGSGFYLRQALGKRHGLSPDQFILGNGSNDLIEMVVHAFLRAGEEAIVPHPSFVVYPMAVQASGGIRVVVTLRDHRLDLEAMARAITPMTKLVFIANPNNPTATIVTADEVEQFMARVPDRAIVMFDEAYFEFAQGPDFPDSLGYVKQGRKVIVLRTFSKAASLAGLRIGYAAASADCIALLNRIRQPFNVNALGQVAALAALQDESHVLECLRMNEAGRHFLCDEFICDGHQIHTIARQLHPDRRGRQRHGRLQLAAQGGRDRAPDVELWHGELSARHRGHAGGEPAAREGAQKGTDREEGRVIRRLTLLGLGLLGGSVAKAARAAGLAREIAAVGRRRESLEPALVDGAVDLITTDLAEGLAGAELCVLATPVATLASLLGDVWRAAPDDVVITDVGSTKAAIVRTAEQLFRTRPLAFVGSHPMAGSEQSGYRVARVDLFAGARVILTPTDATDAHAVKRVAEFWEALGGRVMTLDPATHDRAVAAVSHLPHLVADALVETVLRSDRQFFDVAGPGFRDTTRIAAASPKVWREIYQENRAALTESLRIFRGALDDLERLVETGADEAVERELERIKRAREEVR